MWLGFGEALAAVAGALTGLLFVAVSVKSAALAASRSLSSRAAQTLVLFMTSVLIGLLLVAPQPSAALGSELLAVAVVSGTALRILDRRARPRFRSGRSPLHRKVLPQPDHRRARWRCRAHLSPEGRWWLVLADPGRHGESRGRRRQRVAVPRQGDQLVLWPRELGLAAPFPAARFAAAPAQGATGRMDMRGRMAGCR